MTKDESYVPTGPQQPTPACRGCPAAGEALDGEPEEKRKDYLPYSQVVVFDIGYIHKQILNLYQCYTYPRISPAMLKTQKRRKRRKIPNQKAPRVILKYLPS